MPENKEKELQVTTELVRQKSLEGLSIDKITEVVTGVLEVFKKHNLNKGQMSMIASDLWSKYLRFF